MMERDGVDVPPGSRAGPLLPTPVSSPKSASRFPDGRGLATLVSAAVSPRVLYPLSVLGGLILWEILARRVSQAVLAPPTAVLARLLTEAGTGVLPLAFVRSLGALLLGFALAAAVAIPAGFLMGRSRAVSEAVDPILNAVYVIPPVAFVPFFIIWFGLFFPARVALVFVMCVFEMLVTIAAGVRDVSPEFIDVGRSFGARRAVLIGKVLFPASLPFLFAAFRIGLVRAINAVITAELFFAAVNLGAIMKQSAKNFDTAGLLGVIVVLSGFGLAVQEGLKVLEARALPWHLRE
jgi:NitT/TauT family transport system permease protein